MLVSAARRRPPSFQGPGPHRGTLAPGCLGPANFVAMVGEAHTLKRVQTPDCWRPGPSPGPQEMGRHPKVTFSMGLSSWQPLPLPSVQSWPRWGPGPLLQAAPLLSAPCTVLAEFGSSLWPAESTAGRAGCWRIKCSEGLGAQGTRKCAVSVRSKGTIACS